MTDLGWGDDDEAPWRRGKKPPTIAENSPVTEPPTLRLKRKAAKKAAKTTRKVQPTDKVRPSLAAFPAGPFPVVRDRLNYPLVNDEFYPHAKKAKRKPLKTFSEKTRDNPPKIKVHASKKTGYNGRHGGPVGDTAGNTEDELSTAARKVPPEKRNIAIRLLQQLAERETTNRETAPLRTVPNTLQEIAELEQVITLARLRVLYQQKLDAIELPTEGGFTNKKQADLANQLSITYSRLVKLEAELGLTPSKKDPRVTQGATLRSAYRNAPEKAIASRPEPAPRPSSSSLARHHNFA